MDWQLGLARADDEENMPQLTRLFTPAVNTFPENFTTISLSVDDQVKHCHEVGYAMTESNAAPNTKPRSMQRPARQLGPV
jgi:hypothetical protein